MNKKEDLRRRIEAAIPTEIRGVNCPHRMVPVFTTKHAREYVIDAVVKAVGGEMLTAWTKVADNVRS